MLRSMFLVTITILCATTWSVEMTGDSTTPTIEYLGQPCRAKNILGGRLVPAPDGSKEWLVLCNTNEATNMELIFVDFELNTGRVITCPSGQGAWALTPVPGDRLVVGTYYDGKMMVFDLKTMQFIKDVKVPGEQYVWNAVLGNDGHLYGGTYPHAVLAELNLDDFTVTEHTHESTGNLYLRNVTATADGRLLCTYCNANVETMLFDPAAKTFSKPPQGLGDSRGIPLWNGYLVQDNKVFDGTTLAPVDKLPFPTPSDSNTTWSAVAALTSSDTLYLRQDNRLYRYRAGDKDLTKVAEFDSRLMGGLRGVSKTGKLVGTYGQDYYIVEPGGQPQLKNLPVEAAGRPPHFLRPDGKGKLWGGPWFGQTLFSVDLITSKVANTGVVCFNGGEVYDTAFLNNKVYAVAYVGGDVIEYDPSQPFDLWNGNPHNIAVVGPDYIRPVAGISVGPDSKLYSGWMAKYGKYGGAIAVTDTATSKTELFRDPVGPQAISGLAVDKNSMYVGTSIDANGLSAKAGTSPKFAVLDWKNHKITFEKELPGGDAVDHVLYDPKTGKVAMRAAKEVWVFDPATRKLSKPELPPCTGVLAGDTLGRIYYGSDNLLVIADLSSGKVLETITGPGKAVEKVGVSPAVATEGVFISSGPDVSRIRPLTIK